MSNFSASCNLQVVSKNVLIIGGDSTIGSALKKRLRIEGFKVTATTRCHKRHHDSSVVYLDLSHPASFISIQGLYYDVVVFCASIASVKECEDDPEQTSLINVDATMKLLRILGDSGSHLVFLSTNMVFDGSKPCVPISDNPNPNTEYGRQKAMVESRLLSEYPHSSVIRLTKVLHSRMPLFTDWLDRLRSGLCIYPYANRLMAPISLHLAIDTLLWLVTHKLCGIFQVSSNSDISYADAAFQLADLSTADSNLVRPINLSFARPVDGSASPPTAYASLEFSCAFVSISPPPEPLEAIRSIFH
jgi:dTDP-4-dehydrorhamnose reductase